MPRKAQTREARLLLTDERFCRNEADRVEIVSLVVDKLPRAARDIQLLLLETPHRLSREVQYSILNCLDCSTIAPKSIELLLPCVTDLLNNINSDTAYVSMKLGCLLGRWLLTADSDMRREISRTLLNAARTAWFVSGREGAVHGIEHALNSATLHEGKKLLETVREVALSDRSVSVRRSAYHILRTGHWWGGNGAPVQLHVYAKKLGKSLEYPQPGQSAP